VRRRIDVPPGDGRATPLNDKKLGGEPLYKEAQTDYAVSSLVESQHDRNNTAEPHLKMLRVRLRGQMKEVELHFEDRQGWILASSAISTLGNNPFKQSTPEFR